MEAIEFWKEMRAVLLATKSEPGSVNVEADADGSKAYAAFVAAVVRLCSLPPPLCEPLVWICIEVFDAPVDHAPASADGSIDPTAADEVHRLVDQIAALPLRSRISLARGLASERKSGRTRRTA